jgi:PAT family beta-lactamase induction signal transducer AmpG
MLFCQASLIAVIAGLGWLDPKTQMGTILLLASSVALFSATQDIAVDAFRREILTDEEMGLGNSVHVNAYRIAGLIPGSLSLILADSLPWESVFAVTAIFMLPGMLMALKVTEPAVSHRPKTLREAVVEPFEEFMSRQGWRSALWILGFILFYKLGDSLCTALATPFYLDMGYTKTDIGLIAKHAGLWPAAIGAIVGGLWMVKLGINRALWLFGFVQMFSILGFAWLSWLGPQADVDLTRRLVLALVIGFEALGVGLGTAAFVAFIAKTTHPAYTATQFALFTSIAVIPRSVINASAGWLVESMGWLNFYWLCFFLAIPGMLILLKMAPWSGAEEIHVK